MSEKKDYTRDKGETGPAGADGATGETGATGPDGPEGPPGTTTWAGIVDKPDEFAPSAHHALHEDGGSDEINVDALSGELTDEQKSAWTKVSGKPTTFDPAGHHTSHEDGGGDEISVVGLAGTTPRAILGDASGGRVARKSMLYIMSGTNANTISIVLVSAWNGDTLGEIDNINKGYSGAYVYLASNGKVLVLKQACFTGTALATLSATIAYNATNLCRTVNAESVQNNIELNVYDVPGGAVKDLTAMVDEGMMVIALTYLTDA